MAAALLRNRGPARRDRLHLSCHAGRRLSGLPPADRCRTDGADRARERLFRGGVLYGASRQPRRARSRLALCGRRRTDGIWSFGALRSGLLFRTLSRGQALAPVAARTACEDRRSGWPARDAHCLRDHDRPARHRSGARDDTGDHPRGIAHRRADPCVQRREKAARKIQCRDTAALRRRDRIRFRGGVVSHYRASRPRGLASGRGRAVGAAYPRLMPNLVCDRQQHRFAHHDATARLGLRSSDRAGA